MRIVQAKRVRASAGVAKVRTLLDTIGEPQLREWVEKISMPRHFTAEAARNRSTAAWLRGILESFDFTVEEQGPYANIVARPPSPAREVVLVGAHYDSVPECPGADDNGSAVAALLGCAAACSLWRPVLPIVFVAFNCEEDGLAGSRDFIANYLPETGLTVRAAHILEMVGYATSAPGSQRVPEGLPLKISDVGDFLGLLANSRSAASMNTVLRRARAYTPDLPVTGLNVMLGLEHFFPTLLRSDHAPFWSAEIPAVLWTDTGEYRNRNYHRLTDTPETLDYAFLRKVTQLVTAAVVEEARRLAV
jgi:Zn-dependent M28 family amino/carboxypeptidase